MYITFTNRHRIYTCIYYTYAHTNQHQHSCTYTPVHKCTCICMCTHVYADASLHGFVLHCAEPPCIKLHCIATQCNICMRMHGHLERIKMGTSMGYVHLHMHMYVHYICMYAIYIIYVVCICKYMTLRINSSKFCTSLDEALQRLHWKHLQTVQRIHHWMRPSERSGEDLGVGG